VIIYRRHTPSVRSRARASAVLLLALALAGCFDSKRPTAPGRFLGAAEIRLQLSTDEPGSRLLDLTAFTKSTQNAIVILAQSRIAVDTGRRIVPFRVDLAPCLAVNSSGGTGCDLSLSAVLRDSAALFLDSASVGPIAVASTSDTVSFPSLVLRRVGRIAVSTAVPRVGIGEQIAMNATLLSVSGDTLSSKTVTWSSSNPNVATVATTGVVTGVLPGTATITATRDGASGSVTLTVPFQAVVRWTVASPLPAGSLPLNTYNMLSVAPNETYLVTDGQIVRYDGRSLTTVANIGFTGRAIGGRSGEMVVVGWDGYVARFNGTTVSPRTSIVAKDLLSIWAGGPDGYIAVGVGGTIMSGDGTTWRAMASGTQRTLRAVCGTSPGTIFAAGDSATILRYNGTSWAPTQVPINAGATVTGLYCPDGQNAFASVSTFPGVVLRFNGTSWTAVPLPSTAQSNFQGIHGSSASDVYAVGPCGASAHFDGTTWSVPSVPWDCWSSPILAVSVLAPGTAIAAGNEGVTYQLQGNVWQELTNSPSYRGVSAQSPSNIIAVGLFGTIDRFDGSAWVPMNSNTRASLFGVWSDASNSAFAVGAFGTVLRYDGATWTRMTAPSINGTLLDVWGTSSSNLFAVGDGGTIERFNGTSWQAVSSGTFSTLRRLWGSGPNDVFAVGDAGTILHFDGTAWRSMPSGTQNGLLGLWGSGPADVYAVGTAETIVHFDGAQWRVVQTGGLAAFQSVWGSGPADVYVIGCGTRDGGSRPSLRFDGTRWKAATEVCALDMDGFPQGGALAVRWGRGIYTGTSPTGRVGSRIQAPPITSR
jgi:hypothetical protein